MVIQLSAARCPPSRSSDPRRLLHPPSTPLIIGRPKQFRHVCLSNASSSTSTRSDLFSAYSPSQLSSAAESGFGFGPQNLSVFAQTLKVLSFPFAIFIHFSLRPPYTPLANGVMRRKPIVCNCAYVNSLNHPFSIISATPSAWSITTTLWVSNSRTYAITVKRGRESMQC